MTLILFGKQEKKQPKCNPRENMHFFPVQKRKDFHKQIHNENQETFKIDKCINKTVKSKLTTKTKKHSK